MDSVKVVMNWSSGKDAALAYHLLTQDYRYKVTHLLTTINAEHDRIFMHGIRENLLEMQAHRMSKPLLKVKLPASPDDSLYKQAMLDNLTSLKAEGITAAAYGDIFLEDLKLWREENLTQLDLHGVFPIWKVDSRELIHEFIASGFGSIICCVNDANLDESALGRNIDADFIHSLPADVDPCGENGEFHSFAFTGPIFKRPLHIRVGEKVYRPLEETHPGATSAVLPLPGARRTKGFWFCDLLPAP